MSARHVIHHHGVISIDLFEVPPRGDDAFLAAWAGEGSGTLYRALRDDAAFRYVAVGTGGSYAPVYEDGEPDAVAGATLMAPFEIAPADDDAFVAAWLKPRAVLAEQRGFIGGRLLKAADADFRFVEITRWSSPLMVQRASRRPGAEPPPFTAFPALYLEADAGASSR